MAANDVTISLAASSTSIKVKRTTSRSSDTQHEPAQIAGADSVVIAAGGNTVITLGPNDALYIERVDTPNSAAKAIHCGGSRGKFDS